MVHQAWVGCVGTVLVRRQIFLDAGRILPLWARDDTVRCGHYWWNRRDVVGASRPISARILGTQTGCGGRWMALFRGSRGDTRAVRHECWDALATVGASGLVYVWLTIACRGDFFHGKPVKLTLSPPPPLLLIL